MTDPFHRRSLLPQISQPSAAGLRARKSGANRTLYTVEPLPLERASSVPLRQAAVAVGALPQKGAGNSAARIDDFFLSSQHHSVKGVDSWKTVLDTEKEKFHSISMWGELMYRKVLRETSHMPTPNPLRTAVCCMLLHRIAPLIGSAEELMKNLLREVFCAVYYSFQDYLEDKLNADDAALEGEEGDHSYDQEVVRTLEDNGASGGDPASLKHLVSSLTHRYTFFQLLHELQQARIRVIGLPSRVVIRCIDQWRLRVLRITFTNWRGDIIHGRSRRKKTAATVEFLFRKKCRKRLLEHLLAWRAFVLERRHRNIQDHEATQKRLLQRMGRHIQQLEAENKSLKEQLAAIRSSHTSATIELTNMLTLLAKFRHVEEQLAAEPPPPSAASTAGATLSVAQPSEGARAIVCCDSDTVSPGAPAAASRDQHRTTGSPALTPRAESRRQNLAALLPELNKETRRRETTSAGGQEDRTALTSDEVRAIELEAEKVAGGPNRYQQLCEFLDLDPLALNAQAHGGQQTAVNSELSVGQGPPHGRAGPVELSATVAASTVSASTKEKPVNYHDVLDWVSVRSQRLVLTMQPNSQGLRRCSNFTIDFRDSIRLACVLVSLGVDVSFVEDVAVMHDLIDRATLVLKVARCFFSPSDAAWPDVAAVEATDIVKAKGGKISKLLFAFFRKFGHLPLSAQGPPTVEIATALHDAGGFASLSTVKPMSGGRAPSVDEGAGLEEYGSMSGSPSSPIHHAQSHREVCFGEMVEETIPETQFAAWFRELAAPDSDDEATNFFDVTLGGSVTGSVNEKMQRRMSRLSFRNGAPGSPVDKGKSSRKKSRNQELTEAMIRWVRQKISLQHEGRDVPNFSSMKSDEVLFCVLQQMFPKMNLDAKDPRVRLKRMQECLSKKLHLTRVTLGKELLKKRDYFAVQDDLSVPVKELLLMLFFADQEIVINM